MKWNGDTPEEREAWAAVSRAERNWRRDRSADCVTEYVRARARAIRMREVVRCQRRARAGREVVE